MPTVRIDRRFCGPPNSGNGGYVCGLLADELGGWDCVITLHRPPPLDTDLEMRGSVNEARLCEGEQLIASGVRDAVTVDVPPPPNIAEAAEAREGFTGFCDHVFPTCFVCGPERDEGDGLRIFPGKLADGSGRVAACWHPDDSLLDRSGHVATRFLWSALDCPGYFAVEHLAGPAVLGRMAATIVGASVPRQSLIVSGWGIESSGRKHVAGTALHDGEGRLVAAAVATWISLKDRPPRR